MKLIALLAAGALLGAGCGAPEKIEATNEVTDFVPGPWPRDFERSALLVANVVTIEGPKGLLDHVALGQDDQLLDYTVETLADGFRQTLIKKQGVGYVEIKAALDALDITAMHGIIVIERPGSVPVVVTAKGQAWWRSTDPAGPLEGPKERRGEQLELRTR